MTTPPAPIANQARERPRFITYKMRCGRSIKVLDTPQARANAKRMGWIEISTK